MRERIAFATGAARFVLSAAALLCYAMAAGCSGPRALISTISEPDSILDGTRTIPIDVYLDRLAVLVPMRSDTTAVEAIASDFGMTVADSGRFPQGLTVLNLKAPVSRAQVLEYADSLQRRDRDLFLRAGLLVSRSNVYSPMGVFNEIVVGMSPQGPSKPPAGVAHGWTQLEMDSTRPGKFVIYSPSPRGSVDAIRAAKLYAAIPGVRYAVPNLYHVIYRTSDPTKEPIFDRQWHLNNTGLESGVVDADIDADQAWSLAKGSGVVVAVMDGGFDIAHEDLKANLWANDDDCSDDRDNDGNKYPNDLHGWDFYGCLVKCGTGLTRETCYECGHASDSNCSDGISTKTCGDLALTCVTYVPDDLHGTAVAGLIGARGDNNLGGTGVAPECKLMLLRSSIDENLIGRMFDYARMNAADVINCSWRLSPYQILTHSARDAILDASERGREGKGCVIAFAMSNVNQSDCTGANPFDEILMLERSDGEDAVIAVSGSNNKDEKVTDTGSGDCMDVLAPTYGGTLNVATTDHSSDIGYNSSGRGWLPPCPTPTSGLSQDCTSNNYTYCFTGTSAAAPMVSGAAALILSANPELSAPEVQHLIEDTADKIQTGPGSTAANYDASTGYSRGSGSGSTHGWGRLNTYEAVRIATAGGTDAFIRKNSLDWGNTQQTPGTLLDASGVPVSVTASVDVKATTSTSMSTPTSSDAFDAVAETFRPGQVNRVFVRIRNRGWKDDTVKIHVALSYPGASLDPLPNDFWTNFDSDSWTEGKWFHAGSSEKTIAGKSGPSYAAKSGDEPVTIAEIRFTAPSRPATGTSACLFVVLDGSNDHPAAKSRVASTATSADLDVNALCEGDNNIAQKRY